jgi:hypothetical protein
VREVAVEDLPEFRGTPSRVNSGLDERAQPLSNDGQPITIDTRQRDADAEKAAGPKTEGKTDSKPAGKGKGK